MKNTIKAESGDSTGIRKLVNEIVKERQKIDRCEGDVVAAYVRIARHLADLRQLAKKDWAKQLKAIGMHPRVAGRYLKISQHWQDEIGLRESDLLARLPPDLLKLEWLCRVPPVKLSDLLDTLDCKKATRPQVIAAVREALGEDPPTKAEDDVEKFVERFIGRLAKTIDRLNENFPEAGQQKQARDLLANGLQQVLDSLGT
jgi:molybdopterin converting factor small subunit